MNFFRHKDLGNHLLQLCPKVVKHPVYYMATACLRRGIDPTTSTSSSGLSASLERRARATHLPQNGHVATLLSVTPLSPFNPIKARNMYTCGVRNPTDDVSVYSLCCDWYKPLNLRTNKQNPKGLPSSEILGLGHTTRSITEWWKRLLLYRSKLHKLCSQWFGKSLTPVGHLPSTSSLTIHLGNSDNAPYFLRKYTGTH